VAVIFKELRSHELEQWRLPVLMGLESKRLQQAAREDAKAGKSSKSSSLVDAASSTCSSLATLRGNVLFDKRLMATVFEFASDTTQQWPAAVLRRCAAQLRLRSGLHGTR
jgi:hypothetical protein